jgi:NADH-quinone oxidoreductase subunit N
MLVGLAAAPYFKNELNTDGTAAVLFYLVAYGAMTIGAFQVLSYLSTPQQPVETVDDLGGLSVSHPGVALFMGLYLFSLIGMPPTGGFWGKLLLLFGVLGANLSGMSPPDHTWLYGSLALVMAVNAAIAGWYYLRVIAVMYLRTPVRPLPRPRSRAGLATLRLCAAVTLGLAYPRPLLGVIKQAVGPQVAPGGQVAPEPADQRAAVVP